MLSSPCTYNVYDMTRRLFASIVTGTVAAATCAVVAGEHPNVVLIYADDLGWGDLGCYGSPDVLTPNADRLAAEGRLMTGAHAAAATSTPSRFALLTGMYAFRQDGTDVANGDAAMIISPETYTLADMMRSAGYVTAVIGKWHLGLGRESGRQDWNAPLDGTPADLGFDYSYIMAATADRVPCIFIEDGMIANPDPEHPVEVSYTHPFDGEPDYRANPGLAYKQQSSHGHDNSIINGIGRIGYMKGGGASIWRDEDIADSITARAVRFIEAHRHEPFFLYFATNDIHVPRMPYERFRGKSPLGLRGEAIMQLDWSVGRIMQALDEAGIADDTILILTSDNGPVIDDGYCDRAAELLGSHRPWGAMRGTKYSVFEAGTCVPALVRWPAVIPAGTRTDALATQVDLLRSLASVVGAAVPADAAPDSRDSSPAWFGAGTGDGRAWIVEQGYTLALVTPGWKYVAPSHYPGVVPWGVAVPSGCDTVPQLFKDGDETRNVARQYPAQTETMKLMLDSIVGFRHVSPAGCRHECDER